MDPGIALIHTSAGAILPLMSYFAREAPHYRLTNLLDDGLMSCFNGEDHLSAVEKLGEMINSAHKTYHSEAAIITCSAVGQADLLRIQNETDIPVLKIDVPMAEYAVEHYRKIGLVATFAPGGKASMELLKQIANKKGHSPVIEFILVEEAYTALLNGEGKIHDRLLIDRMLKLRDKVDVFVLSQVSMSPLKAEAERALDVPVLSSPEECLKALKELTL